MKRILCVLLMLAMLFVLAGCGKKDPAPETDADGNVIGTAPKLGSIVVLFTGEVDGAYGQEESGPMGYAALAAYARKLEKEGETVTLIDGGDALVDQTADGALDSEALVKLMNAVGYTLAVPGQKEFALGADAFLALARDSAEFTYLSSNIVDSGSGEAPFAEYKMVEYNNVKVAYVGITTPKAAPADDGKYSFCDGDNGRALYQRVQRAVNLARSEGADYVIGVGHLGTAPADSPWTAVELIANLSGMDVLLDANSQSVYEGANIVDMDGKSVLLCSVGTQMTNIGELRIDFDEGTITFSLIKDLKDEDSDVLAKIEDLKK